MNEIVKAINPFKRDEHYIKKEYFIIKKILSFMLVFISSMLIGEVIVIVGLSIAGYDFLHGVMPSDDIMRLIKYYGFSIHAIVTILYCKLIEKRNLTSMGMVREKVKQSYFFGMGIAIVLLGVILLLGVVSGSIIYDGKGEELNIVFIFAYLLGFIIQGAMEEIMCRGFLMNSLRKEVSTFTAIVISSVAFAFPHFSTLFASGIIIGIIGVANLLLFSTIVSLLMIKYNNIWVSSAVHSIWNFILAIIIGINVSGVGIKSSVFNFRTSKSMTWLSGGEYGVEAGILCTVVLIMFVILLVRKEAMGILREKKYEI